VNTRWFGCSLVNNEVERWLIVSVKWCKRLEERKKRRGKDMPWNVKHNATCLVLSIHSLYFFFLTHKSWKQPTGCPYYPASFLSLSTYYTHWMRGGSPLYLATLNIKIFPSTSNTGSISSRPFSLSPPSSLSTFNTLSTPLPASHPLTL